MPKRCAFGCPPSTRTHHLFPNPKRFPETFKSWVALLGGKLECPGDYDYYSKKKVCDIHFADKDRNRNNRLNCLAIPSFFLPTNISNVTNICEATPETDIVRPSTSALVLGTPFAPQPTYETAIESTSIPNLLTERVVLEHSYSKMVPISNAEKKLRQTNISNVTNICEATPETDIVCPSTSALVLAERVVLEHSYSKMAPISNAEKKLRQIPTKKKPQSKQLVIYERQLKNLRATIKKLRKQKINFKSRLAKIKHLTNETSFRNVTKNMTVASKIFTKMQFTQSNQKASGRRFTIEEKIMSLSIYKRSPKCYSLLSRLFVLPSAKTLRLLLSNIKLKSGINDIVFEKIKETVSRMNLEDRLCTVIFDEMSISPQINYEFHKDEIKGTSDLNEKKIADHVLVFMIKGVKTNFKQPVAYYFTNSISKFMLKKVITDVIVKIQATGLTVLCTICDQGTANVGAINELIQETKKCYLEKGKAWRHEVFEINKKQIVPLYDVPHLLKGLRNNILNKDLIYTDFNDENKEKTIKWQFFQDVYSADKCCGELRLLHKITEEHINPDKIKKMRVKTAAQIFSHSVAVVTDHLTARGLLNQECRQIIPFVTLIDKLFDSLNSSTFHVPDGKIYKGCVKKTSAHHDLWQKAIRTLKSVKFVQTKISANKIKVLESNVPTVKNFIKTIEGMQLLWKILNQKYSFDSMLTRNFNQDPLENFFGNIRSYGARNNSPNCISFEGAYKSLLLNNYNSVHSIHANCEKDENNCLQNLSFFFNRQITADVPEENTSIALSDNVLIESNSEDLGQSSYVCGWVLTKCLKNIIKGCKICKKDLITTKNSKSHDFIKAKEYNLNKKWLIYPTDECEKYFNEIQNVATSVLQKNVPRRNIKKNIKLITNTLITFPSSCSQHKEKLNDYFDSVSINIIIYSWCRSINRILTGKINYEGEDEFKLIAKEYYNKHKHMKTHK